AVRSDVHLIAVGTPVNADHTPDLSQVESVTRSIASVLRVGDLVLLESTVPPGTCEQLVGRLLKSLTGLDHLKDYDLAHSPERVIPGNVLHEIVHNDRIVGGTTHVATQRAGELYRRFSKGTVHLTDAKTAE